MFVLPESGENPRQNQILFDEAKKLYDLFFEETNRLGGLQWQMFLEADKDPEWKSIDKIQPLDNATDEIKWFILCVKQRIKWVRKWKNEHIKEIARFFLGE